MTKKIILILSLFAMLQMACDDTPPPEKPVTAANQPDTSPSPTTTPPQSINAQDTILKVLHRYYSDLAAEELHEAIYFAPILERYFSLENKTREEIAEITRRTFKAVDSREIVIDPTSFQINPIGEDYEVIFSGKVNVRYLGETQEKSEAFHNRFVFNKNYRIKIYDKVDGSENTKSQRASDGLKSGYRIQQIIERMAAPESMEVTLDQKVGIYYLHREGAFTQIHHFSTFAQLLDAYPAVKEIVSDLSCQMKTESLPLFDCDGFSKEGCFVDKIEGFTLFSEMYQTLEEYELRKVGNDEVQAAKTAQGMVTHQLTETSNSIALFFGKVDGKWRLIAIDAASFDCSA